MLDHVRPATDGVQQGAGDHFLAHAVLGDERRHVSGTGWTCAPLTVDVESRAVRCNGRRIELTSREADIIFALYIARGHPLSQLMLWERCWIGKGWRHVPPEFANTVDQAIKRLRKSLKQQCPDIPDLCHPLVTNIWGQGFALRNLAALDTDC